LSVASKDVSGRERQQRYDAGPALQAGRGVSDYRTIDHVLESYGLHGRYMYGKTTERTANKTQNITESYTEIKYSDMYDR
jgi:hypothetical protein